MPLGEVIQRLVECAMEREYQPHLILVPELIPYYISFSDRELASNCILLRNFIKSMIQERRQRTAG